MKKNYYISVLLLSLFISLSSSCTTTKITNVQKTYGEKLPYKVLECSTTEMEEVDIFYTTDSLDFKYQEIGYVTAYATPDIPDSLILKRLQYNSYLLCGNAVIQTSSVNTIKDGLSVKEFTGVSVIIEKDSVYYTNYPFEADYSFFDFASEDYNNEIEETTVFGKVMLGVVLVSSVIIVIFFPDDEEEFEDGI